MSADSTHEVAEATSPDRTSPRIRTKVLVVVGVLVVLVLAGGASYYASGSPDGLNRVAADHGFDHTAKDSPTGGSPLADYGVRGIDDERLSGGLAGVVGVVIVLALGSGVAVVVRRRTRARQADGPGH
jgi:cobalt/nickel transport protein